MLRSFVLVAVSAMLIPSASAQQVVELMSAAKHPSRATIERAAKQAGGSRSAYLFETAVIFPQLAVGEGGGEKWETSFVIVNMTTGSAQFNLGFFDDSGAPMRVTFTTSKDGAVAASDTYLTATLAAEGSMTVNVVSDGSAVRTGFAILEPPSTSQRLGGVAIFRQTVPGRPVFESVVPLCDYDDWAFYMPFDNTSGIDTGIALVNPSNSQTAKVSLFFIDEAGNLLVEKSLELKSGEHTSFSLTNKYPELGGKRGTLYAESSIDYLSALGLRFNTGGGGAFTSIPVLNWSGMY